MDIILKFGEHYYEFGESSVWLQFLLTVLGAFLAFGSALLFYYKRIKSEKKEEELKKEITNRNILKYHKLLIENLIKNTKNQIESFDKYKVEQEKDLLNVIPPKQVATNDFKRLIYINKDIFEAFNHFNGNKNDWIETLKKLHTTIDYIDGTYSEIYRMTTNHLLESYRKASEIKQKIDLIPDRLSLIAFHLRKQLGEERWNNDIYVFVNKAIKQYEILVREKADFNRVNFEYLDPMLKTIVENYQEELFFEEVIFLAKNSRVKMNDIETDVNNMIELIGEIKIVLEKSLTKVEKLNQELNNVL